MESWFTPLCGAVATITVAIIEAIAAWERKKAKEERTIADKNRKRIDAIESGVESLLRDSIISRYNKYMEQRCIPIYGMENVEEMYGSYSALGGDGTITKLVEELRKLPSNPVKHAN